MLCSKAISTLKSPSYKRKLGIESGLAATYRGTLFYEHQHGN